MTSLARIATSPEPAGAARIELARIAPIRMGPLSVEPAMRRIAHVDGREEFVEPRVMQVLTALLQADGATVSRDDLIETCWAGRFVGDDAVQRAIKQTRRLAEGIGGGVFRIETIPRVGYRLIPEAALAARMPEHSGVLSMAPRRWLSVLVLIALLSAAGGYALWRSLAAPAAPVSLAVLPFSDLSPGRDNTHFAEGLAEEILTQLSQEPQMRVAGRSSSALFGVGADAREVGRRLDVDYVLEGSVRRVGDDMRIDVALVDTRNGMRLWSRDFDGATDDIFAIQSEIARAIAGQLRLDFVRAPPAGPLRTSGEVRMLYVTARGLMRDREPGRMEAAVGLLRRAVALDPSYAPAWSSLGAALYMSGGPGGATSPSLRAHAMAHVRHALALAPDLAEAHSTATMIMGFDGLEALRHIERAAALDPNSSEIQLRLAGMREIWGDYEVALEAWRRSIALDPLWEPPLRRGSSLAWQLGRRNEAVAMLRRYERVGEPWRAQALWGYLEATRGDYSKSARHLEAAIRLAPESYRRGYEERLGVVLWQLGETVRARQLSSLVDALWGPRHRSPPSLDALRRMNRNYHFHPIDAHVIFVSSLAMLNSGRSRELLALYDSSDGLMGHGPHRPIEPVRELLHSGPISAVALRHAGRTAEADRRIAATVRTIALWTQRGPVPAHEYSYFAQTWALAGRRDLALASLERALDGGWVYGEGGLSEIAEEPAFRSLRGDPRFERIRARLRAHLARERAEYLAQR